MSLLFVQSGDRSGRLACASEYPLPPRQLALNITGPQQNFRQAPRTPRRNMTMLFAAAPYLVRGLTRQELPAVQALFEANPGYFMAAVGQPPLPDEAQRQFEELPPPHLTFSERWFAGVFDGQGTLRGLLIVVSDLSAAGVWHIALFFLDDQTRGTGTATRLHAALEAWARAGGARWLRLAVISGNVAAERFWDKSGYKEARTRPYVSAGGETVTARVLVRPLSGGTVGDYLRLVPRDAPNSPLP